MIHTSQLVLHGHYMLTCPDGIKEVECSSIHPPRLSTDGLLVLPREDGGAWAFTGRGRCHWDADKVKLEGLSVDPKRLKTNDLIEGRKKINEWKEKSLQTSKESASMGSGEQNLLQHSKKGFKSMPIAIPNSEALRKENFVSARGKRESTEPQVTVTNRQLRFNSFMCKEMLTEGVSRAVIWVETGKNKKPSKLTAFLYNPANPPKGLVPKGENPETYGWNLSIGMGKGDKANKIFACFISTGKLLAAHGLELDEQTNLVFADDAIEIDLKQNAFQLEFAKAETRKVEPREPKEKESKETTPAAGKKLVDEDDV